MERDIGVQRYAMDPRLASAAEIVKEVGGVVTGVLWCRKLVPNLMYLRGLTHFRAIYGVQRYVVVPLFF